MCSRLLLDETATKWIEKTARSLVGKAGLTSQDLPDIQQDLILDLLQRLPQLDENRASKSTFLFDLLAHKAANIVRDRQRACRDRNKETPFPSLPDSEDELPTFQVVEFDAEKAYEPFGVYRQSETGMVQNRPVLGSKGQSYALAYRG
jgi:DNA-directed RNA polymerase specialized sigma24 family protein